MTEVRRINARSPLPTRRYSTTIPRRQAQGKPCPLPRRAINCQVAIHRTREPAGDIEPEPRSAAIGAPPPFEFIEHHRLLFRLDPLPLIAAVPRRAPVFAVDPITYLSISRPIPT